MVSEPSRETLQAAEALTDELRIRDQSGEPFYSRAETKALILAALQQAQAPARTFPVMYDRKDKAGPLRIPWLLAEKAYSVYRARHGYEQSLDRMAERGGFYAHELDEFVPTWRDEVRAPAPAEEDWKAALELIRRRIARELGDCQAYWDYDATEFLKRFGIEVPAPADPGASAPPEERAR